MMTHHAPKNADDVAEPLSAVIASRWYRYRSRFGGFLVLTLLLAVTVPLSRGSQRSLRPPRVFHEQVGHSADSPRLASFDSSASNERQHSVNSDAATAAPAAADAKQSIVAPVAVTTITVPTAALAVELPTSSAGQGDRLGTSTTAHQQATGGGKSRLAVLFWTTFWRDSFEMYLKESSLPPNSNCSQQCELVYDRRRVREADVVLFHAPDLRSQQLPDVRSADQLWVLFTLEAPPHGYVKPEFDGMFNVTMTYRSDADVEVGYGHTEGIVGTGAKAPPLPPSIANAADFANRKPYAYWIVSNCAGSRMAYVHELAKYIRVDVFGGCGPRQARPCRSSTSAAPDGECVEELSATYAFYLAFENSLCTDYITEKMWRPLVSTGGAIPVVIGAQPSRYAQVAPPGSFVHAESFASPRELASHLTRVASSHELFVSHHLWRRSYRAQVGWEGEFARGVCRLCESAHDGAWRRQRPAKPDVFSWFSAGCRSQWPQGRR